MLVTFLNGTNLEIDLIFQIDSSNLIFLLHLYGPQAQSLIPSVGQLLTMNCFSNAHRILSISSFLILINSHLNYYSMTLTSECKCFVKITKNNQGRMVLAKG